MVRIIVLIDTEGKKLMPKRKGTKTQFLNPSYNYATLQVWRSEYEFHIRRDIVSPCLARKTPTWQLVEHSVGNNAINRNINGY